MEELFKKLANIKSKLVKIADKLDRDGQDGAADLIDSLIGEIPIMMLADLSEEVSDESVKDTLQELDDEEDCGVLDEVSDDEREEIESVYRDLGKSLGLDS